MIYSLYIHTNLGTYTYTNAYKHTYLGGAIFVDFNDSVVQQSQHPVRQHVGCQKLGGRGIAIEHSTCLDKKSQDNVI